VAWRIEYARSVRKDVRKLDPQDQRRIREYLENRVLGLDNPRRLGQPLQGQLTSLWRYRVGRFGVVCELRDKSMIVLVVRIGHRSSVYE